MSRPDNALMPLAIRRCCIALVLLIAYGAPAAYAQSGLLSPPRPANATKSDAPATTEVATYTVDDVRAALERARSQLENIEAGGESPPDAPPGTPVTDILERMTLARMLVSSYEKQLNSLAKVDAAIKRQEDAQRANEAWRGFEQAPPYSVLLVDELRDELDAAKGALANAKSTAALFERLDGSYAAKLKASQGNARLAAEAADRARGTPAYAKREWENQLAALRAAVDNAVQGLLQVALRGERAQAAAAAATAELYERKLAAVGSSVDLPRAELDRVLAEVDARRRTAERDLERATRASEAATRAAAKAQAESEAAAAAGPASGTTALSRQENLQRAAAAANEVALTASQKVFLLREYLLQLDSEKAAWEARAAALDLKDPVRARAAYDRLNESMAGLKATKQYLEQQLKTVDTRLRDEEARRRSPTFTDSPAAQQTIDALRERQADLRRALDNALPLERLVAHFRTDYQDRREVSYVARAKDSAAAAWLQVRDFWNFELFAIDDSFETAEGRRIAVKRSVTVGKTFGAALIVLIGYWISRFVVRRIERKAVAMGRATPQGAALVRKWILFLVAAVLGIVALLSASIPLTAFAFLGGALAIAAGFGLQTLLKNLVSGVMLLIERPLRLGDLVEVDGIRGRVTEIGIRASTIRSADGIESMIPNSRFLEGNMTNWTYSSPQARQSFTIGVAYGSPLRKVTELLGDALERHGLVLKDPKPQVYLDEYADSAINFTATYWIEMTEQGDARRVKSDLLLMIDRAFADEGISIPFPQRDVHLSSAVPVPVAIVNQADRGHAAGSPP